MVPAFGASPAVDDNDDENDDDNGKGEDEREDDGNDDDGALRGRSLGRVVPGATVPLSLIHI